MICIYHSRDLDGKCSAAIIKKKYPLCELYPFDYGESLKLDYISNNHSIAYLCDVIPEEESFLELAKKLKLFWIDHHQSAISMSEKNGLSVLEGKRESGRASACRLCWEYEFDYNVPKGVALLSDYDIWNLHSEEVLEFQYGMRSLGSNSPEDNIWDKIFSYDDDFVKDIVNRGKMVLEVEDINNAEKCKLFAFESLIDGYKAITLGMLGCNSRTFKSVWNPDKYDVMMSIGIREFEGNENDIFSVSLYTDKRNIDVSKIAKNHGGGGHKQAAGFQCDKIPFSRI